MTPAPVEIARKVLEERRYSAEAKALARAVIELSAENERRVNALGAILLLTDEPLRCSGQPECDIVEHKVARLARAALSPTEGDGRKENNGG